MGVGIDIMRRERGGGVAQCHSGKNAVGGKKKQDVEKKNVKKKKKRRSFQARRWQVLTPSPTLLAARAPLPPVACLSEAGVDAGGQQLGSPTQRTRSFNMSSASRRLGPSPEEAEQSERFRYGK